MPQSVTTKILTTSLSWFCIDAVPGNERIPRILRDYFSAATGRGANKAIAHFLQNPDAEGLSQLFASLLNMQGEEKAHAIAVLKATLNSQQGEPWDTIRVIAEFYPDDSGLFSPLLLNVVKLNPGEAMFLFAETPTPICKVWRWK
jgi:mannose-6-phosphate isomerase class I